MQLKGVFLCHNVPENCITISVKLPTLSPERFSLGEGIAHWGRGCNVLGVRLQQATTFESNLTCNESVAWCERLLKHGRAVPFFGGGGGGGFPPVTT